MTKHPWWANWNLTRVLRLLMAIWAAANALMLREPLLGLFAAFFLYQAWANVACCGVATCNRTISSKSKQQNSAATSYEEIS